MLLGKLRGWTVILLLVAIMALFTPMAPPVSAAGPHSFSFHHQTVGQTYSENHCWPCGVFLLFQPGHYTTTPITDWYRCSKCLKYTPYGYTRVVHPICSLGTFITNQVYPDFSGICPN